MHEYIQSIMPMLIQAAILITTAAITTVSGVAIRYLAVKKQDLINKIGSVEYNNKYSIAVDVYNFVEQSFKGKEGVIEDKKALFEQMLLKIMPQLTQEEINYFRESVVGKINTEMKQSKLLEPATPTVTSVEADITVSATSTLQDIIK